MKNNQIFETKFEGNLSLYFILLSKLNTIGKFKEDLIFFK